MGKLNFGLGGRGQKSIFTPKNASKYMGTLPIISRSSWEYAMMNFFDTHPNVLFWASESLKIPYVNPFTKRMANYYPDFLVVFSDKNGKQRREVIEIKPLKETLLEHAKTKKDKAAVALNYYKWSAAKKFCDNNGMHFRVLNETDIFGKK
jgi:hypothetical protein